MKVSTRVSAVIVSLIVLFITSISTVAMRDRGIEPYMDEETQEIVREVCEEYGIADSLVIAIIEAESTCNPDAFNPTCGTVGLGQINPTAHAERIKRLGVTDLHDPRQNVTVMCDYLLELFEKYDDPYVVVGMYHGERNVVKRAERGEWSSYQKRVIERADELELLKDAVG